MIEPGVHLHHGERLGGDLSPPGELEPALWTAPRTWVAGEVLTASLLNTHLRDQLQYLGAADARAASPPGGPLDGQLWRYVADATNGVEWLLAYNTADASANKWHRLGGPPVTAEVNASATTVSAGYAAPPNGPDLTIARAGDYEISQGFRGSGTVNAQAAHSYSIAGSVVSDNDAAFIAATGNPQNASMVRVKVIGAGNTVAAAYKTSAGTLTVIARWMRALPVRIA